MVSQFPLDYLHLVCLGVTKKLVELWLSKGSMSVRLSSRQCAIINEKLFAAESSRPTEINRKTGRIELYRQWKGTNFRTFLLYLGPVCLKSVLKNNVYENFMMLSNAIRILTNPKVCINLAQLAKKMIVKFVESFKQIYGRCFVSYNVHNLLHLSEDVIAYGHLDNFSAFPFESHMLAIKKMVRKGNKQLEQVFNRTLELYQDNHFRESPSNVFPKLMKPNNVLRGENKTYNKVEFETFSLSNDSRNKWFQDKNHRIYQFENAFVQNNQIKIRCQQIRRCENFYVTPFNSTNVFVYISDGQLNSPQSILIEDISSKIFAIKEAESTNSQCIILMHLLHT